MLVGAVCLTDLLSKAYAAPGDARPGRYIVTVKAGNAPETVAAAHGVVPDHVYRATLNGFAGVIPEARLQALQKDPVVVLVEPDQVMRIVAKPPPQPAEVVPTGVSRIGINVRKDVSSVGIAIIDTGIDLDHPDLNVAGQVIFVRGVKNGDDDNGHGTHVAGTAAAKDNDIGVVGVAHWRKPTASRDRGLRWRARQPPTRFGSQAQPNTSARANSPS